MLSKLHLRVSICNVSSQDTTESADTSSSDVSVPDTSLSDISLSSSNTDTCTSLSSLDTSLSLLKKLLCYVKST